MDNLLMFQISVFIKMWVDGVIQNPASLEREKEATPPPPPNQFIPINKLACYGNNLSRNPLQGQLGGYLAERSIVRRQKTNKASKNGVGEGKTKRQTNHQTRSDS
jgi:hypothetical protein